MCFLVNPATVFSLALPSFGDLLKNSPIYVASFLFVLGVLVFVHEFGHYAVAKFFGVRVEVFSLGFGKRLWGFRRGDTDYRISALPLGGYVKMSGENPMEEHTGDPGEFTSHPRWQRFLIAIAGPTANIILAIAVLTGLYMVHYEYPVYWKKKAVPVAWVDKNSPAEAAGIRPGDRIIKLDDMQEPTWEQMVYEIKMNPNQRVDVALQRGNEIVKTTMVPKASGPEQVGFAGLVAEGPNEVVAVEAGRPAERAGIQAGDEILSVNGVRMRSYLDLADLLQPTKNAPVDILLSRDGKQFTVKVAPEFRAAGSDPTEKYRIGATLGEAMEVGKLPFGKAFSRSIEECRTGSRLIFQLVGKMIERKISIRAMSGPIGMTKMSGEAAKQGFLPLLGLMALISLNLAIFNLLPIPILDGGLMLMLVIEGILRRDIKIEIKERVYQAAFVFLLLFFAVVIYNDLAKSFHG
ncbi:MAG TPA: RIP metalloprotease RseP [Candidatus Angelobacter sp.]|nr:RIP metalloprotease RseP [Candidatus Angelobacter sp.]